MKQNLYDPSLLRPADDLLIKVERRGRCARQEDPEQILMIFKSVKFYLNQQTNKHYIPITTYNSRDFSGSDTQSFQSFLFW